MPSNRRSSQAAQRKGERGMLMAALMAALAIMMIFSTLALQAWGDMLRRDNEAEMIFRGQEISRGIYRYRLDHGGQSPATLELLMEPGPKGQYYLRKLYSDPLVKDGKWGMLYTGPGGTIVDPAIEAVPGSAGGLGGGLSGVGLGNDPTQQQNQPGQKPKQKNDSKNKKNQPGSSSGFGSFGNQSAGAGQYSGLPIAGVKTLSADKPFRYYRGIQEYGRWYFTYLDVQNMLAAGQPGANPPGAAPPNPSGGTTKP